MNHLWGKHHVVVWGCDSMYKVREDWLQVGGGAVNSAAKLASNILAESIMPAQ